MSKTTPAVTPHKWTADDFVKAYQELCQESGFQIVFEPRFVQSRDTGLYSFAIASGIQPLPKEPS